MTTRYLLAAWLILGGTTGAAQEAFQNRTANTLTAPASVPSPPAALSDISWFAGRWTGTGLGGRCEEMWTGPEGGSILGTFRLIRDGQVVFYEILTFQEQAGSLVLKLKHFNADLTGWEEKNDMVSFRLLKMERGAVYFDGLTFKRSGDSLEIFLAIRNRADGTVREERFAMTRAGGS
jgi:hypothetical protein